MNNAKMWLVVKPTVGVPLFLGAVAVGSFAVHVAVLSNTMWVSDFLTGVPMGTSAETAALKTDNAIAKAAFVDENPVVTDGQKIWVVLPDGTTAQATLATVQTAPPEI